MNFKKNMTQTIFTIINKKQKYLCFSSCSFESTSFKAIRETKSAFTFFESQEKAEKYLMEAKEATLKAVKILTERLQRLEEMKYPRGIENINKALKSAYKTYKILSFNNANALQIIKKEI